MSMMAQDWLICISGFTIGIIFIILYSHCQFYVCMKISKVYLAISEIPVHTESVSHEFSSSRLTQIGSQMLPNNVPKGKRTVSLD